MDTDGSPGVKIAAEKFGPYLDPHKTVFVFDEHCPGSSLNPSLLFYLNVRSGCIDPQGLREGVIGQFIIRREFRPLLRNVGSVVVEAGNYLLVEPLQRASHLRERSHYVPCIGNAQQPC